MSRQNTRRMVSLLAALLLLNVFLPAPGHAQDDDDCPAYVADVLALVNETCAAVGRNEACYGHADVQAIFIDPDAPLDFIAPSDRVPVEALAGIAAGPLNLARERWGVAVLSLQLATIPETLPGQVTRFLIMGDTTLTRDAAPAAEPVPPFQAFYFSTGLGPPACHEAPDALVVKSPPDVTVELHVNNLPVQLGSTVVLTLAEASLDGETVPAMVVTLLAGRISTAINGEPVVLELPDPAAAEVYPVFAVTLNEDGVVDGESQLVVPTLEVATPTVQAACANATALALLDEGVPCDLPLEPVLPGATLPARGEPDDSRIFIAWHNGTCEPTPALTSPISFDWGVGCFDSAAHANAHPYPADYQLWLDREPMDMGGLQQVGPFPSDPYCPWAWGFTLPSRVIAPGEHTLTIEETITDTWSALNGNGRNAGEQVTLTCTFVVEEPGE